MPQQRISERIVEQNVVAPGGPGCLDRMECELEELQRLRAQQGCFVAPDMTESYHDSFSSITVSCGVPDVTPLGPFIPRPKKRKEREKQRVNESKRGVAATWQ